MSVPQDGESGAATITLHCLDDGTSDLLLFDAEGVGLPEPYGPEVVMRAVERIASVLDGYRQRNGDFARQAVRRRCVTHNGIEQAYLRMPKTEGPRWSPEGEDWGGPGARHLQDLVWHPFTRWEVREDHGRIVIYTPEPDAPDLCVSAPISYEECGRLLTHIGGSPQP